MSLRRFIALNGLRRGIALWRVQRRMQSALRLSAYVNRLGPTWRMHHGEKPRLTGYRRER